MPTCDIDFDSSPTFRLLIKQFLIECPHLLEDLEEAFSEIEQDYQHAAGADAQPRYARTIWKYRCKSRDFRRGAAGAFRIIAFYSEQTNTLYPLLLYFKPRTAKPANETIDAALTELVDILKRGPTAQVPAICECCSIADDDTIREEKYTDYSTDKLFVFVLCGRCIAQLNLHIDRTPGFNGWLIRKLPNRPRGHNLSGQRECEAHTWSADGLWPL